MQYLIHSDQSSAAKTNYKAAQRVANEWVQRNHRNVRIEKWDLALGSCLEVWYF